MNDKLDDIKYILSNIKNDLEVIKNVIDVKNEIIIDRASNNYFNNLFTNISALKRYSNISLDRKNQKSKVSISILIMHLEKLLSGDKTILKITNDDINLLELCVSEIDNFSNSLDFYYEDDTEEKFFANIREVYESLNRISGNDFLKNGDNTKDIITKYMKILEKYHDIYKNFPSRSKLSLTNNKYKKLDVDIYLSINALENLLYEIFFEIIKSNDKLPYGKEGLLPDNFKEYYISLLKSHRYQELLNIQMLDKKIDDSLIRQRLRNNYIAIVSSIKQIVNYYKNDIENVQYDTLEKDEQDKYYDLDLFDDSNYQVSSNDRKSINYIIKYDNLNKKMRNSKISRKELKILHILNEKMEAIKNAVSSIVNNLNISNELPKHHIVVKKSKYTGKHIQKNNKKNKAL